MSVHDCTDGPAFGMAFGFQQVRPSEVLADHVFCGHGGFAYCDRKEGSGDYYPVLQSIFDVDCSEKPESQYLQKYQPHRWRRPVD
eukprot:3939476-Rhodomonas_salina.1